MKEKCIIKKMNNIYVIHEREFIRMKENVYKIGKTTNNIEIRSRNYPKGSVLLYCNTCIDCHKVEREIIKLFRLKYKHKPEYGNEYFEGNVNQMISDIDEIIKKQRSLYGNEQHSPIKRPPPPYIKNKNEEDNISEYEKSKADFINNLATSAFTLLFPNYERRIKKI